MPRLQPGLIKSESLGLILVKCSHNSNVQPSLITLCSGTLVLKVWSMESSFSVAWGMVRNGDSQTSPWFLSCVHESLRGTWVIFVTNKTWEHFNASALVECQHISVCPFHNLIVGLWNAWLVYWGWPELHLCSDMLESPRISHKLSRQSLFPGRGPMRAKGPSPASWDWVKI